MLMDNSSLFRIYASYALDPNDVVAFLKQPLVTLVLGLVAGAVGMYFGKVLPALTERKKADHQISIDRLDILEKAADRAAERLSQLLKLFEDEPSVPVSISAREYDQATQAILTYQRARVDAARKLPRLVEEIASIQGQILRLRQRLFADKKTESERNLSKLQELLDQISDDVSQVAERLANTPRVWVREPGDSALPPEHLLREGDIFLST
jgi:uncharacterized protein YukE